MTVRWPAEQSQPQSAVGEILSGMVPIPYRGLKAVDGCWAWAPVRMPRASEGAQTPCPPGGTSPVLPVAAIYLVCLSGKRASLTANAALHSQLLCAWLLVSQGNRHIGAGKGHFR